MKRLLFLFFLFGVVSLFGANEANISTIEKQENYRESLEAFDARISELNEKLTGKNIWVERYQVKEELQALKNEQYQLERNIKRFWGKRDKVSKERLAEYLKQKEILKSQLQLLGDFADSGYDTLYHIEELSAAPEVANPVAILIALSYIREMKSKKSEYVDKLEKLQETITALNEKIAVLEKKRELVKLYPDAENYKKVLLQVEDDIDTAEDMIADFQPVLQIFSTTLSIFNKKVSETELDLKSKIKTQTVKLGNIAIILLIFIGFVFLVKMLLKRYITDAERLYITNRTLNILTVIIITLIIAFNYINNLTYILTVLGFVSAGIAFAMKDWFMSILGWFVIVLGGQIHVGDRIRVVKDNEDFLGDVLEIGFTRIVLFEDVTLPSYERNRRAGRIIFIPNNYIFTYLFQNYTFNGLKTVWDGIDIMVTFDSNHKKAVHIAREISTKYSKGYSDLTRKQLNTLRAKYNLKNSSVEPRVFTFIEKYGMKISTWYLTNSYATLTLRSRISAEIIEAYNAEADIAIAYPTKTIRLSPAEMESPEVTEAIRKAEKDPKNEA